MSTNFAVHAPTVRPGIPELSRERVSDDRFHHGLEMWQVRREPTPERSDKACPLDASLILPLEAVHGVLGLQNLLRHLDQSTRAGSDASG